MHDIIATPLPEQYLELKTSKLLEKFGSGGHKPGSGSAAALVGVVACKLLRTVITLTASRDTYKENIPQLRLGNREVLDQIEPALTEFIQTDAEHFNRVIVARQLRDTESDPKEKRRLRDRALEELKKATEIPLQIADCCIKLATFGLTVFDLGFKSARGDSGVAINTALAAANGALAIIYLNLTSFKGSSWAVDIREKADAALSRTREIQIELFRRISGLRSEGIESPQLNLPL